MAGSAETSETADATQPLAEGLGMGLRDLAFAVKALQLYPGSSPVVREAVERAHEALQRWLSGGPLELAVHPESISWRDQDLAAAAHAVSHLAERLHQRGVAHVTLGQALTPEGLQRLAELLSRDVQSLLEDGGLGSIQEGEPIPGVGLEMLRLERLYEEPEEDEGEEDPWDALLRGYRREDGEPGGIDWTHLAGHPGELDDFLEWVLDEDTDLGELGDVSRIELLRAVCSRVGAAAARLGSQHLEAVASVLAGFYDRLDREIWMDLLSDPLPLEDDAGETTDDAGETTGDAGETPGDAGAHGDLGPWLAGALEPAQVGDLFAYAFETRRSASPRIFQLLDHVLERRDERERTARAIRDAVERQAGGGGRTFAELWPELDDALRGEDPEPWVQSSYRATLDGVLSDTLPGNPWPLDRLQPRLREMAPVYVLQRKGRVLLEILEQESDDDDYAAVAQELERHLPELVVQGQYLATEEILGVLVRHLAPASGRSVAQRQVAREILLRFCNQHTLREVVRNLAGKASTQIDAATRIFQSLGPMAIPALLEALSQEGSRAVRLHLVRMLAAMGDRALAEIEKHLKDRRWFFVRNLAWIIGEIGDPAFGSHLALTSDHPDVRVRREAARALAKLGGPAATTSLRARLEDDDAEVRLLAIRGLGHAGSTSAVDDLVDVLSRRNWSGHRTESIRAAAIALGRIGDPRAEKHLRRVARRPWLFRRRRMRATEAARWALRVLEGEGAGRAPDADDALQPDRTEAGPGAPPSEPDAPGPPRGADTPSRAAASGSSSSSPSGAAGGGTRESP